MEGAQGTHGTSQWTMEEIYPYYWKDCSYKRVIFFFKTKQCEQKTTSHSLSNPFTVPSEPHCLPNLSLRSCSDATAQAAELPNCIPVLPVGLSETFKHFHWRVPGFICTSKQICFNKTEQKLCQNTSMQTSMRASLPVYHILEKHTWIISRTAW